MSQPLDVLCMGNAIVDIIASVEDDFLIAQSVAKGGMMLIDEARAETIYAAMGPVTVISGGSAANTAVGVAGFGVKAGYFGKVRTDEVGGFFTHDLRKTGVAFDTDPATDGPATARSYILVTPDGQRTMNTYLGACQNLTTADIREETVEAAGLLYMEGYLWDPPAAKDAFVKAAGIAHGALEALRTDGVLGIVTRGAAGSVAVQGAATVTAEAAPIERLVDSTGAGDLFAAGFLAGLARGRDLKTCARLGGLAAAEVIQHIGARPATDLARLASQSGLTL